MTKGFVTVPALLAAVALFSSFSQDIYAQDTIIITDADRFERGRVGRAVLMLRDAIAAGDTEGFTQRLAAGFSESGLVSGKGEAQAKFAELVASVGIRDTTEIPHSRCIGESKRLRRSPLWDFDLTRCEISLSRGTLATVHSRAVFYALTPDSAGVEDSRVMRVGRDIVLDFELQGENWKVVRSIGLIEFVNHGVSIIQARSGAAPKG